MSIFRRQKYPEDQTPQHETTATSHEGYAENNRDAVLESLRAIGDAFGLSADEIVVVGSAVLTLNDLPRRARDVDLLVEPTSFNKLAEMMEGKASYTGNGFTLDQEPSFGSRPGRITFKPDEGSDLLQVELIAGLAAHLDDSDSFTDLVTAGTEGHDGYHCLPLIVVYNRKSATLSNPLGRSPEALERDQYDMGLIKNKLLGRQSMILGGAAINQP